MVDSAIERMLIRIVGDPVMNNFRTENTYDYLKLFNDFEGEKRKFIRKTNLIIKLPSTLDKRCEEILKKKFLKCLHMSTHRNEMYLLNDNIVIDSKLVDKRFREATDLIVNHMKIILETGPVRDISQILIVGGFSESSFVQEVIHEALDDTNGIKVIIPKDAGITIAKGTDLFGRLPQIMKSRVLRFTYGVTVAPIFVEGIDLEEKKFKSDTGLRCRDVFSIILSADSEVTNEFSVERTHATIGYFQTIMHLDVYYTKEKNPRFNTDPGCTFLGGLKVEIPNPSKVHVTFQFGMTELNISAHETSNIIPYTTQLNMIW